MHDDDLLLPALPADPDPHRRPEQGVRHRVLPTLKRDHRSVARHHPGHPERDGVRDRRDRVQPGPFLLEHLGRGPAGDPMHPGVDLLTERLAGGLQLRERVVLRQQVGVLRDQVGLGDLHARLRPTLGRRVGRDTRVDRDPVMPGERHHGRITHRHPGHVLGGHRLLVVGQHVRRRPTQGAQGDIQGGHHRGRGLVPDRQHHTEPAPRQHATNNVVLSPSITGPSPKSYCNHIPGSTTHGRCTRTRPNR